MLKEPLIVDVWGEDNGQGVLLASIPRFAATITTGRRPFTSKTALAT